jgi:phosphoribosylformimino-5-aminoimidazole carboxamide ribonucleotide (ProFAR) isomerase
MIQSVQKVVKIPLIVAGSIDSVDRVQKMLDLKVWAFTIGSAFFDKKFVPTGNLSDQINTVLNLLQH